MSIPASELAVRDWARLQTGILAAVGDDARKIDVDYSGDQASTHLTMHRSGGAPSRLLPFDNCVMTFDCWGRGRGAALTLATAVVDALHDSREEQMNADAYLRGAEVLSIAYLPDPTGQHRYVVAANLVINARAAA